MDRVGMLGMVDKVGLEAVSRSFLPSQEVLGRKPG